MGSVKEKKARVTTQTLWILDSPPRRIKEQYADRPRETMPVLSL